MLKKELMIPLFVGMVVLQLAVVAGVIARYEIILGQGKTYKFQTAPVDPYDAFRGRYVALDIKESNINRKTDVPLKQGDRVYAVIEVDNNGFARFANFQHEKPVDGVDYLIVKIRYVYSGRVSLHIPFDRFYMEETEALDAEHAYRDNSRKNNTYIEVRILKGYGVIEELFIDGIPVRDYIKRAD